MKQLPISETRTKNELLEHYYLEKRLSNKLKYSTRKERKYLYNDLYKELFEKIPYFYNRKMDYNKRQEKVSNQIMHLKKYLNQGGTFLEVGAGDCALSLQICSLQKEVFAADVTYQIPEKKELPENFHFSLSDGTGIDIAEESIDIAYSNHLMEHLHPDDALEQIKCIYNALKPKGIYIIITPHRYTGPHDISRYFDDIATGFHLKEYTNKELYYILKRAGFSKINYFSQKELYRNLQIWPSIILEKIFAPMPHSFRKEVSKKHLFKKFLGVRIAAVK